MRRASHVNVPSRSSASSEERVWLSPFEPVGTRTLGIWNHVVQWILLQ